MQEPKSSTECEFEMCPLQDYSSEIDLAKKSLMRCSMCKNRFYCSAKCQKSDWKEHKWNCSVLPVGGLPPATVVEINDEFKTEFERVVAILKEVAAALKDEKKKLSAPMLAPLLKIPSELPDRLRYKRAIQDSDTFKYRLPIVTACRLLLIDYISALDEARRQKYEEFFASMELPTSFCEMYGPKIAGRPADLSPGEYAMLAQVMPIWVMPEMQSAKARKKEEEGEEAAGEPNEGMQWVWLAVMLKRAYSAKSG
ncbi:hypothetical protein K438DRAFT_1749449 [Mycena galopus ATCC 62051]|nr:hypothetical protein K438DRAFT_1749449 [Mycena galopus ATCC 62051]